jgi:hypothetical protein
MLAGAAGGQSSIPSGGWRPVLTDTRGPFTAMILQSASTTATCLTGPSLTTIEANVADGGENHQVVGAGSVTASRPMISLMGLNGSGSGPISQASQAKLTTSGGQPYTFVQGQVEPGVTGAKLVLSNGSEVQATIADASLVAWWPGNADATSARLARGSGVTVQKLTFTPLTFAPISPPNGPPPSGSTGSPSSR